MAVQHAREKGLSERQACRLVSQPRGTQRYVPTQRDDEDRLTQAIITLASQYGRYGYRRITALLNEAGWKVGKDRVQTVAMDDVGSALDTPKILHPKKRALLAPFPDAEV